MFWSKSVKVMAKNCSQKHTSISNNSSQHFYFLRFNGRFPVVPALAGSLSVSFSTCSRRLSLGISGTGLFTFLSPNHVKAHKEHEAMTPIYSLASSFPCHHQNYTKLLAEWELLSLCQCPFDTGSNSEHFSHIQKSNCSM